MAAFQDQMLLNFVHVLSMQYGNRFNGDSFSVQHVANDTCIYVADRCIFRGLLAFHAVVQGFSCLPY